MRRAVINDENSNHTYVAVIFKDGSVVMDWDGRRQPGRTKRGDLVAEIPAKSIYAAPIRARQLLNLEPTEHKG